MTGPIFTPIEMLSKLIGFDTTSRNSNLELIDFVGEYLTAHEVPYILDKSPEGTKANLYATIGPAIPGGVVLSGHTDVVPVDGQNWETDPFTLSDKGERLFGRGTSDMKGFIAAALALVPQMVSAKLPTPVHFAFSYDEEVGCLGVRSLIAHIREHLPHPRIVIIGEPSDMKVVNAHKGIRSYETTVHGLEAHSSATTVGVNAVMIAAKLIGFLDEIGKELIARGDPSGRFDPPFTSVHVGTIDGGTAVNIIPKRCHFAWEYRPLPEDDENEVVERFQAFVHEKVLPTMQAIAPETNVVTEAKAHVPPLKVEADSPAETLALLLSAQNRAQAVSYGTEAGLFQEAGISAVVCGPGSILQAHKPNEYIERDQIDQCAAFLDRLIAHLSKR